MIRPFQIIKSLKRDMSTHKFISVGGFIEKDEILTVTSVSILGDKVVIIGTLLIASEE